MRSTLTLLGVLLLLAGCGSQPQDLKSPCVGLEGSPCGPKRPVNMDLVFKA